VKTPQTIGRYEVADVIGQGGTGALYRARDPLIGREVAIKLLRSGHDNRELRDRFSREARAAGGLSHPNIVTIYDVGEHEGLPFIAMAYVRGETFAGLISQRPPLPLPRKLQLAEEVCAGLAHAHEAGIVHRDVKPANLIVGPEGSVRILDFGIARLSASSMTQAGAVIGTLNYMSPEQLQGAPIDARSDIFSFGCVLYELISHQRAFPGDSHGEVFRQILDGAPRPITEYCPDLDPRLVRMIDRALEKDPDRRFQAIASVQKELASIRLSPVPAAPGLPATSRSVSSAEPPSVRTPPPFPAARIQPPDTGSAPGPVLNVRTEDGRTFHFSQRFKIGRDHGCDVRMEDAQVSRQHAIVAFEAGRWVLRDQQSGNGVFVDGRRVEAVAVDPSVTVRLGAEGPRLVMDVERHDPLPPLPLATQTSTGETAVLARYAQRYFGAADDDQSVGSHTMMIRKAFHGVHQKQKRLYRGIVAVVTLVALAAGGYAYRKHVQERQRTVLAKELFYSMKSIDLQIANLERRLAAPGIANAQDQDRARAFREQRRQMEATYDQFIAGLKLYDHVLTPQEQLILRVTRMFGECEMAAPTDYMAEVARYIRNWKSTGRYERAVNRARDLGYTKTIAAAFERQNLPSQFFYLAMQESDFIETASGEQTRMGIAKGMWQFIPETGARYGLRIGPLVGRREPDAADDRHQWEKATQAAASYIKDIYATDAQASGLLVMASYNWGENRVINMLRKMPENPRERNFWKLLEKHRDRVPKETYDYVLSIVSAAVIGENPRLFGYSFDSPLVFN
jgi:membrane-bound lytic murein transglycosylase D